jgi:hypothetical protein
MKSFVSHRLILQTGYLRSYKTSKLVVFKFSKEYRLSVRVIVNGLRTRIIRMTVLISTREPKVAQLTFSSTSIP